MLGNKTNWTLKSRSYSTVLNGFIHLPFVKALVCASLNWQYCTALRQPAVIASLSTEWWMCSTPYIKQQQWAWWEVCAWMHVHKVEPSIRDRENTSTVLCFSQLAESCEMLHPPGDDTKHQALWATCLLHIHRLRSGGLLIHINGSTCKIFVCKGVAEVFKLRLNVHCIFLRHTHHSGMCMSHKC